MASKVEITFNLPSLAAAVSMMHDEFFTRYTKDDYRSRDVIGMCYDNASGELRALNCALHVRRTGRINVANLIYGCVGDDGVFFGQQWTSRFTDVFTVMERLRERGAPELTLTAPLEPIETFRYSRSAAILYMPEPARVELSFCNGDGKTWLTLELLYGATSELLRFADELRLVYGDVINTYKSANEKSSE
ncbi:MAG: hypothetical protein LBC65_04290, partial [Oscillospiraceae bacterium]|nr:hypothetical protein [Oscillospiraceae bacterium]